MKKRTNIHVTSQLGAVALGLLRLPRRVLWDWPKAASARLWRTVLDRPIYGSFLLSLFVVIPLGVGILAMQADQGRFGSSRLPAMWAAEDQAWWATFDLYLERESLRDLSPPRHLLRDGQLHLRGVWHARWQELTHRIDEQGRFAPSVLAPLGPHRGFALTEAGWAVLYHADHFFFGSVYPAVILFYLATGIRRGRWTSRRNQEWLARTALPPLPEDVRLHDDARRQRPKGGA